MKKLVCSFLVLVMCLSMCACGGTDPEPAHEPDGSASPGSDTSETVTLVLTDNMVNEIKSRIESSTFHLIVLYYEQLLIGNDLDLEFTDLEIANHKQTDLYTYKAYGTLYATDNYNREYYQNIDIVFTAEKDDEEDSGYSIDWDVEFVD